MYIQIVFICIFKFLTQRQSLNVKLTPLKISEKLFYNIYWTYKLRKLGFTKKTDCFLYRITLAWHVESLEHLEDKLQR